MQNSKFISDPSVGYLVFPRSETFATDSQRPKHTFCGENNLRGGMCPNCNRPLLILLTLDSSDYRLNIEKVNFPQLFLLFCWTCQLAQDVFSYKQISGKEVKILHFKRGECYSDFPYDNYPIYFPEADAILRELANEDREIISSLNSGLLRLSQVRKLRPDLISPRHQIGGEPYLIQAEGTNEIRCLQCESNMPFFTAIADSGPFGTQFTGNDFVQMLFHLCRKCSIITAYQQSE